MDRGADPLVTGTRAAELVELLAGRGETLAVAESLTAGLLAATLGGVPGASRVLRGGLVVYATDTKHSLAGVPEEVLATDGPVAASTARYLAEGARDRCAASWGLALTGVAGPDPQDGYAPGTVFVGFAGPGCGPESEELSLTGDRWGIRRESVNGAVEGLLRRLGAG